MLTFLAAGVALVVGLIAGWLAASARHAPVTARAQAEAELARQERARSEAALLAARNEVADALRVRAIAETRADEAAKLVENHEALRKQMEDTFAALAQRAFQNVGESLVQNSKQQIDGSLETKKVEIDGLLKPLRDMLDNYRGELTQAERMRNESYGGLQEQIRMLLSAQETAQREATRLANALQSPTVRGSWGEITLRRCVELAGMAEYCDFFTQETVEGDDGRRLRPDMLVRLPNNRIIAVDSKAPTNDYTAAAQAADEEQRKQLLGAHSRNLRRHVDTLSRKEYQSAIGESLDFTVMFLPGEHFLSAALVTDPELFDYAIQRKIYVASPMVLLPLLRAVNAGWKAEKTEENAKRMHDAGVELFNRFVRVMELLAEVGGRLGKTIEKYNETIRSIDSRLWPKGEEMQRMAGSGKELAALAQIEAAPLQSSKLRLTMQSEEEGTVVPIER